MRKKIEEVQAPAVAEIESQLTELIPVESRREEMEAQVERARADALKEVQPELKPIDKKERTIKGQIIETLKANKDKKGFFPKGRRSVSTRAGVAGFKKGPAHIRIKKGVAEADIISWIEEHDRKLASIVVETKKRIHRTHLRQQIRAGAIDKKVLKKLGITVVQREHAYLKTRTAKRGPKAANVKAKSRKAKTIKPN